LPTPEKIYIVGISIINKLQKLKTIKTLFTVLIITGSLFMQSCGSDDDSSNGGSDNCLTLTDQPVQGNFRGTSFVSPAGFYKVYNNGGTTTYRGEIYVKENLESDCFFPTFEGSQDIILFPLPSLDVQTITLSETGDNTLNFNRIVDVETQIELATCGTVSITNYNEVTGELQGTVVAIGQEGSTVNGNFTLLLCEF
jgi:hypothetical protein